MIDEFNNIINGMLSYKNDNFPKCIFYKKNDVTLCVADYSNNYMWINYETLWSVFEKKYGLTYNEVCYFIKDIINKNEHWKNLLPNGRMIK